MRTLLFLSLGLSLVACGDDDGRPRDSGTGVDTGTPVVPDGGGTDTGTPVPDAGGTDSGMMMTGMCPAGSCDLITNAGCDSAMGQACYYAMTEGGAASPMCLTAGTAAEGAACTSDANCREGHTCSPLNRTCVRLCCGDSDSSCNIGDQCSPYADEDGELIGFGFCETPSGCNFAAQTGCEAEQECVYLSMDGTTGCRPNRGGTAGQSEACSESVACQPGFLCLGEPGRCAGACNPMTTPTTCGAGLVCFGVTDWAETIGGCLPMPAM